MRFPLVRASLALLLVLPVGAATAQSPRISSAGDPSVKSDTIYRLAVKPEDYPEQNAAFLLDDGVVRLEADGRGTTTYRQIVQVLRPEAVEDMQEKRWSYDPSHQRLRVNWVRVVRPDGRVVSAKPSQVQESSVPASTDDPVYTERRVRRASLSGVAPGTLVDASYTIEELKPFLPGDFYEWWGVSTGLQVARSRYVVDVPATLPIHIREQNLNFKRREEVVSGRHIYTWATANLPKLKPEPLAADSNGVYMSVGISSPITWSDIGRWYAGLEKPQLGASAMLNARVDSIVRGARTRTDSIRAVHKWVAQDIRYVAIDLGMGGYQPRKPETVIRTAFGDCKDKATLFVAALSHLGIEAFPVLLNSSGGVRREMPSIQQLDHEIAAITRAGGYDFVDLTAAYVPFGELPTPEQGAFGLVVRPEGTSEVVTLPRADAAHNVSETRIVATLAADGSVSGDYEEVARGAAQGGMRELLANPLDSAQRKNLGDAIASKFFEGAESDSLWATDGKNLAIVPRVFIHFRNGRAATTAGPTMVLHHPLKNMSGLGLAASELEKQKPRRTPIDAGKFWGLRTVSTDVRIHLPSGWHAQLPANVRATSEFGSYTNEYAQVGDELRITRRVVGTNNIEPPEKVDALTAWFRAIAADDAKLIVLAKASSTE